MLDETLQKHDEQNEHQRRQIEAAERRQNTANGPQQRLGDAIDEIAYHLHEAVVRIDDAEAYQPAHHRANDEHPDIKAQNDIGYFEPGGEKGIDRVHAIFVAGIGWGGKK